MKTKEPAWLGRITREPSRSEDTTIINISRETHAALVQYARQNGLKLGWLADRILSGRLADLQSRAVPEIEL